jgi:hypothetical protein
MPFVSRQLAVVCRQIVWATMEDNGAGEHRWSLWMGGRPFTIRRGGEEGAYTGIGDEGEAPRVATRTGEESFQIEFPFYPYRRRITFHVGLMTAVVSDRSRPEPPATARAREREPAAVATFSRHSTFTLEADTLQLKAATALHDVLESARSDGEVSIGRWTLRREGASSALDVDEVLRVVASLVGMPSARVGLARASVTDEILDALRFGSDATEYMTEEAALAGASWFLEWFGPRATFYVGTQKEPDWAVLVIGIDDDQVGVLATATPWGQ